MRCESRGAPEVRTVVSSSCVDSGFFLNEDSIPVYLQWVREISFIRYAYQGLALNEFKDASFSKFYDNGSEAPHGGMQGNDFLRALGISKHTVAHSALMLAVLTAAFNILAFLQLLRRAPKFLRFRTGPASRAQVEPKAQGVV